jgi:hypothetical protein
MKCPICDKEIKEYSTDYMEYTLMEEHASCKDEHHLYSYEYVTGNYEECIGNTVFHSHHADSEEERNLQGKQYKAVLELEREHYQKKVNA